MSEIVDLVSSAVKDQTGLTGMTLKGLLAAAKKLDKDAVTKGINRAFPDMVHALEGYWKTYSASVDCCFGMHLESDRPGVGGKLMTILDRNVERYDNPALTKVYEAGRPKVARAVECRVGELGNLLEANLAA